MSQKDLLLNASTDVTVALRRTHGLLQSELSRSRFATETLNASTAALHDLSTRYTAFDDIVSSSRELIIELIRKNKSDRWYYETAIQLLIGTLVWILIRRLFWGPIWLFFGLPFKLMWWTLSLVASAIGVGNDGVAEIREGSEGIERVLGGPTTVEVKGIPEGMLQRMPTQSVAVKQSEVMEELMRETVERIIDGEENVVMVEETERNPKSRRVENDLVDEQVVQGGDRNPKSRRMEYDLEEEQEVRGEQAVQRQQMIVEDPAVQEGQVIIEEPVVQEEQPIQEGYRNPKSRRMEYHPEEEQAAQMEQIILEEPAEQIILEEPAVHEQTAQEGDSSLKPRKIEYDPEEERAVRGEQVVRGGAAIHGEKAFQEEDRNPRSRRISYNPVEELSVLEEVPAVDLPADTREAAEATHDEL